MDGNQHWYRCAHCPVDRRWTQVPCDRHTKGQTADSLTGALLNLLERIADAAETNL